MGIKHMYSSYRYRCPFGDYPRRPASVARDAASCGVLADTFFSPDWANWCHIEGYSVVYLDGHTRFYRDTDRAVCNAAGGGDYNGDYGLQEIVWQTFFDE